MRDSIVLRHMDTALREIDTIAVLPSSESLREINVTSSGQVVVSIRVRRTSRPFGRTSYFHPGLRGVVTATNDFYEWMVRALDGTVQLISRVPDFDRSISTGQVSELRDWFLSNATSPQATREVETYFDDFPMPDLAPAFGQVQMTVRNGIEAAGINRSDSLRKQNRLTPSGFHFLR